MHSSTPRRHTHAPAAVVYHRRPAAGAPATRPRCRTHTLTTSKSAIASLPHAHHPPSRVVRGALLRDDHGNGPRRALGSNACARNNRSSRAVVPHAAAAAPSTTGSADAVLKGRSVAVVGGGPAGMLAAAHLAKLGGTVRPARSAATTLNPPRLIAYICTGTGCLCCAGGCVHVHAGWPASCRVARCMRMGANAFTVFPTVLVGSPCWALTFVCFRLRFGIRALQPTNCVVPLGVCTCH